MLGCCSWAVMRTSRRKRSALICCEAVRLGSSSLIATWRPELTVLGEVHDRHPAPGNDALHLVAATERGRDHGDREVRVGLGHAFASGPSVTLTMPAPPASRIRSMKRSSGSFFRKRTS